MADREYAPLSAVCVRTLSDKVYEKRKAAAFEIEKEESRFTLQFWNIFGWRKLDSSLRNIVHVEQVVA